MTPPAARKVVLVVDDDTSVLHFLRKVLDANAYEVHCYGDTDSALKAVLEQPVDVLLVDKGLPGMNGFSFVEHARMKHPDVGVLLMTGLPERLPKSVHLDGYLAKPFKSPQEVATAVSGALAAMERRALQRQLGQAVAALKH